MKTIPSHSSLFRFALLGLLGLCSLDRGLAQQPASTAFRPALLELTAGGYSYSTKSDLAGDGAIGEIAVHHAEVSVSGRHGLASGLRLVYGLGYDTNQFVATATLPLPDQLSALSLNLGFIRPLNPEWTVALFARPGFYGDFKSLGSRSLNAPLLVTASYTPRRELTWTFALRLDSFSDNSVLPVLGVRWQFAHDWEFAIGFPRTGFDWQVSDACSLHAGAEFQGGSYRVMGNPATRPSLRGSLVDYREVRAGVGLDFKFSPTTTLSLDAGFVTDRRFDFHERNYGLNGDPAGYLKLAFSGHF